MLGMMNKGGGSTNLPIGPFGGVAGRAPGASYPGLGGLASPYLGGGGSAFLGAGGSGLGSGAFGAGRLGGPGNPGNSGVDLAALFGTNMPAAPTVQPGVLPTITQPRRPIIEPPPPRRPLPTAPTVQPTPLPRFQSMGQLLGFVRANPGAISAEIINNWRRSLKRSGGRP
jgi:hypothetical protein